MRTMGTEKCTEQRARDLARRPPRLTWLRDEVADQCRVSALDLLNGVQAGWGKRELAEWLVGPYQSLTMLHLTPDELAWAEVLSVPESRRPREPIPSEAIHYVLQRTQALVLGALDRFATGDDRACLFVLRAHQKGAIVRCTDRRGGGCFAPASERSMRLAERVLSLLAADYLMRADEYEERCTVCRRCATVTFDTEARERGECRTHATSGMRPREQSGIELIERARHTLPPLPHVQRIKAG